MHLFFCILCSILYNKLINISLSVSSVSHSSISIKPKNGSLETLQLIRSTNETTWESQLASEVEDSLMGLSPYLGDLMLSPGR